jgi:hypothetical protein
MEPSNMEMPDETDPKVLFADMVLRFDGQDDPSEPVLPEDGVWGGEPLVAALDVFEAEGVLECTPRLGTVSFTVEGRELRHLLTLVGGTLATRSYDDGLVKLTLSRTCLRGRSFEGGAYVDVAVPLAGVVANVEAARPVSFVVRASQLGAALRGVDDVARFDLTTSYAPPQQPGDGPELVHLTVASDRFERPLQVLPLKRFIDINSKRIGPFDSAAGISVDPALLKAALAYVAPAVEPNDIEHDLDLVELRDGQLMGSTGAVHVAVNAPGFAPHAGLRVPHRFIAVLQGVLPALTNRMRLFDTGKYYLLRDEQIVIGIEKREPPLRSFKKHLAYNAERDRMRFERRGLAGVLAGLAAVLGDEGGSFRLRLNAGLPHVRATLSAQSSDGRKVLSRIQGRRVDPVEVPLDVHLPLAPFRSAILAFEAANVDIDFYRIRDRTTGFLRIVEDEERFVAQTMIGWGKPTKRRRKGASGGEQS